MNKLNSKDIKLLEKLYNLRSDDSVILVSLDENKKNSVNEQNKSLETKNELEGKIDFLNSELETINAEGQDLIFSLTSISQNNYEKVLDSLQLSFNPDVLLKELQTRLPEEVDKLENDIKKTSKELDKVNENLAQLATIIEELDLRKEEALTDQERLNNYIELALDGNINVTRDELTSLFEKLGFEVDEQRQLAKLLMFPEDGLVDFNKNGGKEPVNRFDTEIKPVINFNEKNEEITKSYSFEPEYDNQEPIFEPINFNDFFMDSNVKSEDDVINNDYNFDFDKPIDFEPIFNEPVTEDPIIETSMIEEPVIEEPVIEEPVIEETIQEDKPILNEVNKEEVIEFLTSLGFDSLDFANNDIEKIVNHFDKEQITDNVNLVNSLDIKLDVFVDNIELLFDKELKDKVNTLTEVGKLPVDIYLNPDVLTKYDLSGLQNSINILKESGLEPKNVPLMAY